MRGLQMKNEKFFEYIISDSKMINDINDINMCDDSTLIIINNTDIFINPDLKFSIVSQSRCKFKLDI